MGNQIEPSNIYVLDSFAVLAYFQNEPGGEIVRDLLLDAGNNTLTLYMSYINTGEIYYITYRNLGSERAAELLSDLENLPITFPEVTRARIISAAQIKAQHPISYADAFAVGLARELSVPLLTGDPEFEAIESDVSVIWINANDTET